MTALWNLLGAHTVKIYRDDFVVVPDIIAAGCEALQVVDRAMHFENLIFTIAGFLKLAIDIGGDNETVLTVLRSPVLQHLKTMVRLCFTIEVSPMTVETPTESRIPFKVARICRVDEADAEMRVHRIGVPEALVATEVGQAGINPHPCARGHDHGFGRFNGLGGFFKTF